ncbi:hypothetical protein QUF74_08910 [Candidatus Halobeggiatoa sp. HSG11]|nr:hypothetical protein [Candidatus Halobeggiatoa sp. HSG11]
MKKFILPIVSAITITFVLGGCATSRKVHVVQAGDNKLSCSQLQAELVRLDQAEQDVDSKKGVTGTNVASALFWLPGLVYTYYDAGQAIEAINDRRTSLTKFSNDKGC